MSSEKDGGRRVMCSEHSHNYPLHNGLHFENERCGGNGCWIAHPVNAAAFKQKIATAYESLLALQPRTWTAETIGDAPKGFYWYRFSLSEAWQEEKLPQIKRTLRISGDDHRGPFQAYGPIPQPPTGKDGEG